VRAGAGSVVGAWMTGPVTLTPGGASLAAAGLVGYLPDYGLLGDWHSGRPLPGAGGALAEEN